MNTKSNKTLLIIFLSFYFPSHFQFYLQFNYEQIFMHKSAMQMQHARDIQRGVSAGPNSGNNGNAGSLAAAINPNNLSGLPAIMGASGEIKPHQCQQCLKSFSSNHQLVQHIRVHTGEKPYKCSYCDRRFKQLSHVQQHTRLHTGDYSFICV